MKKLLFLLLIASATLFGSDKKQLELNKQLIEAASKGDFSSVEKFIKVGANIEATREEIINDIYVIDTNALVAAIKNNHEHVVELLLSLGANPNSVEWKTEPIIEAIKSNNPNLVRLLLNAGAEINVGDFSDDRPSSQNPLYFAVELKVNENFAKNNNEIIKMLLEAGAYPNIHNQDNILSTAAKLNKKEVFKLLLEFGADPRQQGFFNNNKNFINYMESSKNKDKVQEYKKILEDFEKHKKEIANKLNESLPNMPSDLVKIVTSYLHK